MYEFTPSFPEDFSNGVKLMVLGEAPGAEEEKEGQPFVGASGKLLMKVLEEHGFNRKNLYISNVFWIRPPDNNVGHFFTSKKSSDEKVIEYPLFKNCFLRAEYKNHIERLEEEISLVNPYVILTVGSTPLWALTGSDQISKMRGEPRLITGPVKYKYSVMFPTFHPAYILRNRSKMDEFKRDIARVKELVDMPPWDWPSMFGEGYNATFGDRKT